MTDDGVSAQRKRLRFRSWHRGTREMDLLLGSFFEAHMETMTAAQLDRYAALLDNSDPDIYGWLTERTPAPALFENDVMALLRRYRFREATP